jgi:hypothetical protein
VKGKVLSLVLGALLLCQLGEPLAASPPRNLGGWDPFLDTVQTRTLRYFLATTDARTGLAPDRWPTGSPSSIAAVGFALTCAPIAAERKLITRQEAAKRVLNTLKFLFSARQGDGGDGMSGYRGFYYHFLAIPEGTRAWKCELSTIDTALLMAGILFCQSYFDRKQTSEREIRRLADSLYRRVDWTWSAEDQPGIMLGWMPKKGMDNQSWHGYNEAMILYILALGSPTHSVKPETWDFWTSTYVWGKYYGKEFVSFGPLFGHQYSHCWIDFRGIRDKYLRERGIDYFENSRRATLSHRDYAIENPLRYAGYGENIWGITPCDGPADTTFEIGGHSRRFISYAGRGVSFDWSLDDGTIAPTGVGGSVAFAPEICIPALKAMRNIPRLWTAYGYLDAFNPTFVTERTGAEGWVDHDYLGIDQGPIVIMIENLRNGFVWDVMKKNPYLVEGLKRAGFTGGWLEGR